MIDEDIISAKIKNSSPSMKIYNLNPVKVLRVILTDKGLKDNLAE